MERNKTKYLIYNIRKFTFSISLILILIFSTIIIIDRAVYIKNITKHIYSASLREQKELLKNEITLVSGFVNDFIDYGFDKDLVLNHLRKIRFGKNNDNYIFIVDYEGTTILNDTKKELEGKNIWNMEDPNGVKFIQEGRKAADKPGGDFIYYSWDQPETGKTAPKVSFIIGIPQLKWMIGSGVYIDTVKYNSEIGIRQIYKTLAFQLMGLIIFSLLLILYIRYKFKNFSKLIFADISQIDNCFINAELTKKTYNISNINYVEFFKIANRANIMIQRQQKAETEKSNIQIRLRLQREQSPLAYVDWNSNNRIIGWNKAAENIFGYTQEEALGKSFDLIIPDWEKEEVSELFQHLGKKTNHERHLNSNITKDGRLITCEWYNNRIVDDRGNDLGITTIAVDITERLHIQNEIEIKNTQLEKSLKEKNILLQEVHHRVKNNLAIVSSMLSLQANSIENEQLLELLQSSRNRIQSMAMVHENIYRNKSLSEINVKNYIEELIGYLMTSYNLWEDNISLIIDVPDINMELDLLIPLGMIVNEIVSNSFKYAYKEGKILELSVILKTIDNKMNLNISDNGTGFNADEPEQKEGSIGMMIIRSLVNQIDGKMEIIAEGKTEYEIITDFTGVPINENSK